MGKQLDTDQNGYKRINHSIDHMTVAASHLEKLLGPLGEDISSYILLALVADITSVGSRLQIFAMQYKEQLECISIDQSNSHSE